MLLGQTQSLIIWRAFFPVKMPWVNENSQSGNGAPSIPTHGFTGNATKIPQPLRPIPSHAFSQSTPSSPSGKAGRSPSGSAFRSPRMEKSASGLLFGRPQSPMQNFEKERPSVKSMYSSSSFLGLRRVASSRKPASERRKQEIETSTFAGKPEAELSARHCRHLKNPVTMCFLGKQTPFDQILHNRISTRFPTLSLVETGKKASLSRRSCLRVRQAPPFQGMLTKYVSLHVFSPN